MRKIIVLFILVSVFVLVAARPPAIPPRWYYNSSGELVPVQGGVTVSLTGTISMTGTVTIPNAVLGSLAFVEDSGAIEAMDMPVSATPAAGVEESYAFRVDNIFTSKNYAQSDTAGGVKAPGLMSVRVELYPAILTDDATPHALTVSECSNTIITTQGWDGTTDITFTLPDISAYDGSLGVLTVEFVDKIGMQDADTDFYITPDASTQIILDGTATGVDEDRVWNDDIDVWDTIKCSSTWTDGNPAGTNYGGVWRCNTVVGAWLDKGS